MYGLWTIDCMISVPPWPFLWELTPVTVHVYERSISEEGMQMTQT